MKGETLFKLVNGIQAQLHNQVYVVGKPGFTVDYAGHGSGDHIGNVLAPESSCFEFPGRVLELQSELQFSLRRHGFENAFLLWM